MRIVWLSPGRRAAPSWKRFCGGNLSAVTQAEGRAASELIGKMFCGGQLWAVRALCRVRACVCGRMVVDGSCDHEQGWANESCFGGFVWECSLDGARRALRTVPYSISRAMSMNREVHSKPPAFSSRCLQGSNLLPLKRESGSSRLPIFHSPSLQTRFLAPF